MVNMDLCVRRREQGHIYIYIYISMQEVGSAELILCGYDRDNFTQKVTTREYPTSASAYQTITKPSDGY